MYRELLSEHIKKTDWAQLQSPCPESDIAKAEKVVGYTFPDDLKALLREWRSLVFTVCKRDD